MNITTTIIKERCKFTMNRIAPCYPMPHRLLPSNTHKWSKCNLYHPLRVLPKRLHLQFAWWYFHKERKSNPRSKQVQFLPHHLKLLSKIHLDPFNYKYRIWDSCHPSCLPHSEGVDIDTGTEDITTAIQSQFCHCPRETGLSSAIITTEIRNLIIPIKGNSTLFFFINI